MSETRAAAPPSCAIVVLNWKGREHLSHLLPSLRAAVARHAEPVPVVIVDNSQLAEDIAFVREEFPEIELVLPECNDYLFSLNAVVASRSEDVVIVLNNDLRVDPGFILPLLDHFADPAVFAVASVAWEWDGSRVQHGQRLMHLRDGWFHHSQACDIDGPMHTIEASGGWSAYRREMFVALGGYDRLFHPMYLEDLDLTYRAWMRGWRSLVEPASVVFHRGGGSSEEQGNARIARLAARNLALFTLRDVGGWGTAAAFLAWLPWRVAYNFASGKRLVALGLLDALRRLPRALAERRIVHGEARLDASEIERRAASPAHLPMLLERAEPARAAS